MVLPESKTFSFRILDSPNIDKVELFLNVNYFCYFCASKNNEQYVEITAKNYIFVLNITNE